MPKDTIAPVLSASLVALLLAGTAPAFAQDTDAAEAPADTAADTGADAAPESAEAPAEATDTGDGAGGDVIDDLPLGSPVAEEGPAPGDVYVADTFGDWQLRCVIVEQGVEPCQLFQVLSDGSGNPTAEVTIFAVPEGRDAAAGATVITPLQTMLTANLRLRVDSGETASYPFLFCDDRGCISRLGFTEAEVDAFRRGATATVTIVPVVAPDQDVDLSMSLTGFTAGFEALESRLTREN